MLEQLSLEHVLIFIVPGFFTVWSYHRFSHSTKPMDFEYFVFSLFWGMVLVGLNATFVPKETFGEVMKNPYAAAFAFSFFGLLLGSIGSLVVTAVQVIKDKVERRRALKRLRK